MLIDISAAPGNGEFRARSAPIRRELVFRGKYTYYKFLVEPRYVRSYKTLYLLLERCLNTHMLPLYPSRLERTGRKFARAWWRHLKACDHYVVNVVSGDR
ncbi:hypothetical protein HBI56_190400 [Parastagonospora nodorum]|uniref:Uncharacterized protein n=1 Tax=Phaeosphaeria nodorum (strain SN15 / ATCC MYA-4574 / FGSC 10173) TaxID=321614 RepID=A0A7U2FEH1_PHANO|nr:hypothetical protein HBH56_144050 [Parastagonospora nodorum]QRD01436.1 hypothetical protein JI435_416670 [Parastagonospora nodorum SN15]KAH3927762.1 hypothetical protein HBH54_149240 [Parastagonospora nodorum]KAH3948097.1 hypothetical protein HBH53_109280 [Parastagonospora nodorum]KAH3962022.1 hypothetical protein HBH51_177890 [Parastagonospora nodorum]